MRCFVAIPLTDTVLDTLERVQDAIPGGRITPRENLHLTLRFLGEVTEHQVADLHEALSGIVAQRFGVEIGGLDLFGGRRTQILFAQVGPTAQLSALQRAVVLAARDTGITLGRERFRPHVTLARFNRPPNSVEARRLGEFLQANARFGPLAFDVDGFGLFRSVLGSGPAQHSELAFYGLRP